MSNACSPSILHGARPRFSSVLRVGRRCLTAELAAAGFMPPEPRLGMEEMLAGGGGGHHSCRGQLFPVLLP